MKQRIFSGIQPSGNLHIGNYLGAIKQWVELQEKHDAFFCIVDLHAITVPQDPETLKERTLEVAKLYLAAGIDFAKAMLFVQSHVREHTELCWILNTVARMGDLEKMTQFKDKSSKENAERVSVGLFDYPVLMAADILLYDTAVVPVGDDQVQHVELARTLARRFNTRFGETFVEPEARIQKEGARIMGLDDPTKKMSKSATSEFNYIALLDDPEMARKKIIKAVTDSGTEVLYSDAKPALVNLINIFSLLGNISVGEVVRRYAGKGYAEFKRDLADTVAEFLVNFQHRFHALSDEETFRILHDGAERARAIASEKMKAVREKVGFLK
jgi:tryptophanyl-tRNA synthetase